jgi:hypothetical protein
MFLRKDSIIKITWQAYNMNEINNLHSTSISCLYQTNSINHCHFMSCMYYVQASRSRNILISYLYVLYIIHQLLPSPVYKNKIYHFLSNSMLALICIRLITANSNSNDFLTPHVHFQIRPRRQKCLILLHSTFKKKKSTHPPSRGVGSFR